MTIKFTFQVLKNLLTQYIIFYDKIQPKHIIYIVAISNTKTNTDIVTNIETAYKYNTSTVMTNNTHVETKMTCVDINLNEGRN